MQTGAELPVAAPELRLRSALIDMERKTASSRAIKTDATIIASWLINAWNARKEGKSSIKSLKGPRKGKIPAIKF